MESDCVPRMAVPEKVSVVVQVDVSLHVFSSEKVLRV